MMKRSFPIVLLLTVLTSIAAFTPAAGARSTTHDARPPAQARADAWVRLCGFDYGCRFNKKPYLPTPYKGNNVYNSGGFHQTATGLLDEGTDIRFWFTLQNDGDTATVVHVQGCRIPAGQHARWQFREIMIGAWKVPDWHPDVVISDRPYATWSWKVHLAPQAKKAITVEIWNKIRGVNKVLKCPVTVWSDAAPGLKDTAVARMITF
jgi:hypothetical protein